MRLVEHDKSKVSRKQKLLVCMFVKLRIKGRREVVKSLLSAGHKPAKVMELAGVSHVTFYCIKKKDMRDCSRLM
ncbi:hypothetical protein ACVXG9_27820 [Escherichia coli]